MTTTHLAKTFRFAAFAIGIGGLTLVGCKTEYELVSTDECPQLIEHGNKILGKGAPTHAEAMSACMSGTPKQRGCVKAAVVPKDLMKCTLVRD